LFYSPTSDGLHRVLRLVGRHFIRARRVEKLFLRGAVVHGWFPYLAGRPRVWAGGLGDGLFGVLLHARALGYPNRLDRGEKRRRQKREDEVVIALTIQEEQSSAREVTHFEGAQKTRMAFALTQLHVSLPLPFCE